MNAGPAAATRPAPAPAAPGPAPAAAVRRHLAGSAALRAVLAALARAGVPAIPLKGPALAEALWEAPEQRPFTDLDLLVRRADLPAALEALNALGYRHRDGGRALAHELVHAAGACFVRDRAWAPVDLHWELVVPPGALRRFPVPVDEVWARTVPADRWGTLTRALAVEDLLLYLALHGALHHPFSDGQWRADLTRLLGRFGATLDWAAVDERAGRWGVRTAVAFALAHAAARPPGGAGPIPLALGRAGRRRRALVSWLSRRAWAGGRLDFLAVLFAADRAAPLAGVLVAALVPPPRWVRTRYGRSLGAGYLTHLGRVVAGAAALAGWPTTR